MNIDQYRAMKAEETQTAQVTEQPQSVTESTKTTPTQAEQAQPTQPIVQPTSTETTPTQVEQPPEKITIDGVGEVTMDELKNGYLRQSDYTRKTQEVSRKNKEADEAVVLYEHLKQNPQLAQQLFQGEQVPASLDPTQSKVIELEEKMYDMMLEKEIEGLQSKYPDFEIKDVLEVAQTKKLTNLEDAYILSKSHKTNTDSQSLDEMKKQARLEVIAEMEREGNATRTIITTNESTPIVQSNAPVVSDAERKIASGFGFTDAEYAKWRDADKIKK